jgi:anti-anti-sigma regulatory factor
VTVYAPQAQPVPAPVAIRLIGVLDSDLVEAFTVLERGLVAFEHATVIVDVRDVQLLGETEMHALAGAVRRARTEGRDVRLDARNLAWRRLSKKEFSAVPPVDAKLRSGVRRTVILAHSGKRRR